MKKDILKRITKDLQELKRGFEADYRANRQGAIKAERTEGMDDTEQAQDLVDKSIKLALANKAARTLEQVIAALEKIEHKTYGICVECEEEIEEKRLLANHFALRCLSCQEDLEHTEKQRKLAKSSSYEMEGDDD